VDATLLIVKPDAIERGLLGEVISRIERKGLRLAVGRLEVIPKEVAERHYSEHVGKPFYEELISFITRGPAFVAVVEGPRETWRVLRQIMGATDPLEAGPGTIRGDFGLTVGENLVHGSDSEASALREIELFFPDYLKARGSTRL
jgi:nucleoside-diphosphate kinase